MNGEADVHCFAVWGPFDFQFIDIGIDEAFGAVEVTNALASHAEIVLNKGQAFWEGVGGAIAGWADQHGGDAAGFDGGVSEDGDVSDGGFLTLTDVEFEGAVLNDGGDVSIVEPVVLVADADVVGGVFCGCVGNGSVGVFEVGSDARELLFDGVSKGLCVEFLVADEVHLDFFRGFSLAEEGSEDGREEGFSVGARAQDDGERGGQKQASERRCEGRNPRTHGGGRSPASPCAVRAQGRVGLILRNRGVDLVAPGEDPAFEIGQFSKSGFLQEAEGAC